MLLTELHYQSCLSQINSGKFIVEDSAMTIENIKQTAAQYAADELGFRSIEDARTKSPRLFKRLYDQCVSDLCTKFRINMSELYAQSTLF